MMFDTLLHKYLRLPYRLNVHFDKKAKDPVATIVLLHGLGNSGESWDEVVSQLPPNVRVISIDLLGFGASPSPRWLKYNTVIQARSVAATLIRLNITQKMTIVGHSMGSLVAVELTRRYPLFVKSLVLCSPPFYNEVQRKTLLPDPNAVLKKIYRMMQKHPEDVVDIIPLFSRLNIVGKAFRVTDENVDIYLGALEASIVHQTALRDVKKLQKPIRILHGMFDPVVIKKNLDGIVKTNQNAKLTVVLAGHEMLGAYIPAVVKVIKNLTQ
jgi:pimeloyl-ACP methyl ester carboxylesterase